METELSSTLYSGSQRKYKIWFRNDKSRSLQPGPDLLLFVAFWANVEKSTHSVLHVVLHRNICSEFHFWACK